MRTFLLVLTFLLSDGCSAQWVGRPAPFDRTGKVYAYWGWNRESFSPSNIRFKGEGYDFTLERVSAMDRPEHFNAKRFLSPSFATIQQYNFRVGYFFDHHYDLSIGTDHMKYVVLPYQDAEIHGHISGTTEQYDGVYDGQKVNLAPGFLEFEHTDGLNYAHTELRRRDDLFTVRNFTIGITEGIGAGVLYPRSNVTLLNKARYDRFHLAGFGASAVAGLNFEFYRIFFIQTEVKGGYINMPDIRTTDSRKDRASQHFVFAQVNLLFGASLRIIGRVPVRATSPTN